MSEDFKQSTRFRSVNAFLSKTLKFFQRPIRLASINVERNLHYSQVFPFLDDFRPDVVCIQELFQSDIPMFERELGMRCIFAQMAETLMVRDDISTPRVCFGVAIFTRLPILSSNTYYYVGEQGVLPTWYKDPSTGNIITNKAVVSVTVSHMSVPYTFATTHFTWSRNGEQRADLKRLFTKLDTIPDFVLAGDFNAPRGREIFSALAARYKDNIPAHYTTSIDSKLHRAKGLQFMVDGLFSTPEYKVSDVKLSEGVSDHMAVTALVSRVV
jgi:endonuclease/exonuclease/phosphatase family metal-dependent hydrolase